MKGVTNNCAEDEARFARAAQRLGATLLCLISLLCGLAPAARAQQWAAGSFELPMEVTWNDKKLTPGEYRFKVVTVSGTQWAVLVERNGDSKQFLVYKREQLGRGKVLPQLVLHLETEATAEVAEMVLPKGAQVLKFQCRHENKKGPDAPRRATIFLRLD